MHNKTDLKNVLLQGDAYSRKSVGGKNKVTEAENSFSESAEFKIGLVESFAPFIGYWLFNAVDKYGRRPINNAFWGAFHHQQISLIIRIVHLVYRYLQTTLCC